MSTGRLARDLYSKGHAIRVGSRVTVKAHGETSLVHTVVEMVGDDCDLKDPRGRINPRVPIELLELADVQVDDAGYLKEPARCWREVDELEPARLAR